MKKLVAMMLLVVSLVAVLVSCSSFKCTVCGEEKSDAWNDEILEDTKNPMTGEVADWGVCTDCAEKLGLSK